MRHVATTARFAYIGSHTLWQPVHDSSLLHSGALSVPFHWHYMYIRSRRWCIMPITSVPNISFTTAALKIQCFGSMPQKSMWTADAAGSTCKICKTRNMRFWVFRDWLTSPEACSSKTRSSSKTMCCQRSTCSNHVFNSQKTATSQKSHLIAILASKSKVVAAWSSLGLPVCIDARVMTPNM